VKGSGPFSSSPAVKSGASSTATPDKTNARLHSAKQPQDAAGLAAAEEKMQKRARLGKLDSFVKVGSHRFSLRIVLFDLCGIVLQTPNADSAGKKRVLGSDTSKLFGAVGINRNPLADATNVENNTGEMNKKAKIRFKFAQGFSDAVRRPVSIAEFM
jgi:hypothetical protein